MCLTRSRVLALAVWGTVILSGQQQPSSPGRAEEPITLDQAVRQAVANNLDLIAERFNVPLAQAQVITANLRPNPILSVYGDLLNLLPPKYSEENGAGPPEYGVRADYIFERGGKRERRVAVAQAAKTVAEFQLLNTFRVLIFNVQSGFVGVLQAKADLALAHENLATFDEIVRINTIRLKAGDLAEAELIRSQVAELQFENTVRQTELQLQTARVNLQILLGRRRNDALVDASGDMRREQMLLSVESLRDQAFSQRPDLKAQQQDDVRSAADVRLQLANAKVDFQIGSEYRRQQGLAGTGNSLGFFFQADMPIYSRNQGEIERARQQQLQSQARVRALEASIENEVEIAWLQYHTALATLDRIEQSLLPKAKDVRQITEFSYRRGEASFLELLDAQRAYNDTVQAYNSARADFAQSLYALDAATAAPTPTEKKP